MEWKEAFAPLASSKETLATYKNPFGFSLAVIEAGENITLGAGGTSVATVSIEFICALFIQKKLIHSRST